MLLNCVMYWRKKSFWPYQVLVYSVVFAYKQQVYAEIWVFKAYEKQCQLFFYPPKYLWKQWMNRELSLLSTNNEFIWKLR